MSRTAEAVLVLATAGLAAFGVLLVNFAEAGGFDARTALTFLVFVIAFGGFLAAVRAWAPRSVPFLIPPAATITAVGFVVVYRLDENLAGRQGWWLLIAAGLASLGLYVVRTGGLELLRRPRYASLAIGVGLVLLPLLPSAGSLPLRGFDVDGALLWVGWRSGTTIVFQPVGVATLLLVVFLTSYLSEHQSAFSVAVHRVGRFRRLEPSQLPPVVVAWAASLGVLVFLRDLGAATLLFGVFVIMTYMVTNRAAYLATGLGLFASGVVMAAWLLPHFHQQVSAWLDPWANYEGAGHQLVQGLFALGAGSLTGTGLGLGQPDLIPGAATGFVFTAMAEEMGLAGSVVVLAAYALLVATGFGIALQARDLFRKLLASGLSLVLGLQTILVLAGLINLLPVTGLTIPLMSYGGSSLVAGFLLLGLLARVSHEERT